MLLNRPANRSSASLKDRVQRIRDRTRWVHQEAQWLKYQTQQTQHTRFLQLLQAAPRQTMALPLPYRDFPYERNIHFHFREDLLENLHLCLNPTASSASLRTVGVFGLGGVGKTQLALEYAYRHTEDYDAIFWVKSATEAQIRDSICTYARKIQGESHTGPEEDAKLLKIFQEWLMTAVVHGKSASD